MASNLILAVCAFLRREDLARMGENLRWKLLARFWREPIDTLRGLIVLLRAKSQQDQQDFEFYYLNGSHRPLLEMHRNSLIATLSVYDSESVGCIDRRIISFIDATIFHHHIHTLARA